MREKRDDPDTAMIIAVGLVGALAVFLLIVALQALYYHVESAELLQKVYSQSPEELTLLRSKQEERLHSCRWLDEKNGVAAIPIERAMELTVRDIQTSATLTWKGLGN